MKKTLWILGFTGILATSLFYFVGDNHPVMDDSDKATPASMTPSSEKQQTNQDTGKPLVENFAAEYQVDSLPQKDGLLTAEQLTLTDFVDVSIGIDDITVDLPMADEAFLKQVEAYDALDEAWESSIASAADIDLDNRPAGWKIVGVNYYDPTQTGITKALPTVQNPEHTVVATVEDTKRKQQVAQREVAFKEKLDSHPERQPLHELRQRLNQE